MSNTDEIPVSLDLNEEVRIFVHNRLRTFGLEHPKHKFAIVCWITDLVIDVVKEIYDYLTENECSKVLKTGGDIIGKDRTTFHRYTKKSPL